MNQVNFITIFLTGLLAGGLSCVAVQGGLLATTIVQSQEEKLKTNAKNQPALPILSFLIAKLVAYTFLGFFLGLIGSFFAVSISMKVIMLVAVSIFMLGTALNILNVHPIFRYFAIQPPRFLSRLVKKQSKSREIFSPAILGAFTIFIPCGVTQAMIALSIASASPILGALILFTFVLGTSPVFFILGYFVTKLSEIFKSRFMKVAAIFIIILAFFNLNNAFALSGNPFNLEKIVNGIKCTVLYCKNDNLQNQQTVERQTIEFTNRGYEPFEFWVKAGTKTAITLSNQNAGGCIQAFTIPSLNIQTVVPVGTSQTITLNPQSPGDIPFMCSMGMYRGIIHAL